jgi:hypothetical protein
MIGSVTDVVNVALDVDVEFSADLLCGGANRSNGSALARTTTATHRRRRFMTVTPLLFVVVGVAAADG